MARGVLLIFSTNCDLPSISRESIRDEAIRREREGLENMEKVLLIDVLLPSTMTVTGTENYRVF